MRKNDILDKLKDIYKTLNDGLEGEFDGYEGTDDQPDCRLTEASISLEELINNLTDDLLNN
jgi:hypothetical protein